jgi:hypothetical protein
VPPLALIVTNGYGCTVAWLSGAPFLSMSAGVKWDAGIYLDIAEHGYHLYRCGADPALAFPPDKWCGNSGWFPFYPLLVRLLHVIGLPTAVAATVITQLALLAAFAVLWRLLGARIRANSMLCIGLATVFPGSLYYHLTYPIALGVLALLACAVALRSGSWVRAGAAGALGAATYPSTAMLIGLIPAVAVLGWRDSGLGVRAAKGVAGAAFASLGALACALITWHETGRWNAFFLTQEKYGHGVRNPLTTAFRIVASGELPRPSAGSPLIAASVNAPRVQFIVVVAIVAFAVVAAAARSARVIRTGREASLDLAVLIMTVVLAVIPLVAGPNVAAYRSHALLLPSLVLLRDLPAWILGALLAACAVTAAMLGAVFYGGILV